MYIRSLGEDEFVAGVVLGSFSLVSFILRPLVGRLVDVRGAGRVFALGALLLAAGTAGLLSPAIVVLLFASAVRGVGWAGVNTGANVLLAGLAPRERRGEAAGYFALFPAAASTAGPPLALMWLQRGGDFQSIFIACAVLAAGAVLVAGRLTRLSNQAVTSAPRGRALARGSLLARDSLLPSGLLILVMFTQPAVLGFYPLYAEQLGLSGTAIAAFYVLSGVSAVLSRAAFGRVSDRASRGHAVISGFILIGLSLLLLQAAEPALVLGAAVLYAAGHGMCQPALTALAIDRADSSKLGVSMATFSASYQIGMGAGSVVAGALITGLGYSALYWAMLGVAVGGIVATVLHWTALSRKSESF